MMRILLGVCAALALAVAVLFWRNDVLATKAARLQGELTSAILITKTFKQSIEGAASRFERVTAKNKEIAVALFAAKLAKKRAVEWGNLSFEKMIEAEEKAVIEKGKVYVKNVCDLRGII